MRDRGVTDVVIVLAGDPQGRVAYERELDALIAARGLQGIVHRVGHCADMPAAFRAASVVAVPSVEPEAFGRSAVEAQALGTPVVVSDLGAVPETVLAPPEVPAAQRTGWRVPRRRRRPGGGRDRGPLPRGERPRRHDPARTCPRGGALLPGGHGGRYARRLCRTHRRPDFGASIVTDLLRHAPIEPNSIDRVDTGKVDLSESSARVSHRISRAMGGQDRPRMGFGFVGCRFVVSSGDQSHS